jgi:hypothetical protein
MGRQRALRRRTRCSGFEGMAGMWFDSFAVGSMLVASKFGFGDGSDAPPRAVPIRQSKNRCRAPMGLWSYSAGLKRAPDRAGPVRFNSRFSRQSGLCCLLYMSGLGAISLPCGQGALGFSQLPLIRGGDTGRSELYHGLLGITAGSQQLQSSRMGP